MPRFTQSGSTAAVADQVAPDYHGACVRVRMFVSEHGLEDRHRTLLWLTKMYVASSQRVDVRFLGTAYI